MVSVGIIGLGAYVPPNEMSNEDWMEYVDTSDEWITTKTGMKKRRIANSDMCTSDLAVEACKQALEDANLKPEDIDLLILFELKQYLMLKIHLLFFLFENILLLLNTTKSAESSINRKDYSCYKFGGITT